MNISPPYKEFVSVKDACVLLSLLVDFYLFDFKCFDGKICFSEKFVGTIV